MASISNVLSLIGRGELDAGLDAIIEAAAGRRKQLRKQAGKALAESAKPGTRVRIADKVKPRYIAGRTGVVVGRRGTKLLVDLDSPAHGPKRVFHRGIGCPPAILEIVEAD